METATTSTTNAGRFSKIFDSDGVPVFVLKWTVEDVGDWVSNVLDFPQYEQCFKSNCVNGRKLIHINASNLPKIGITDFAHVQKIAAAVRAQLNISEERWDRSIALPPKDTNEHFLERKSFYGSDSRSLTFEQHVRYLKDFDRHGVPVPEET